MKKKTIEIPVTKTKKKIVEVYEAGDFLEVQVTKGNLLKGDKILILKESFPSYSISVFCSKKQEFVDIGLYSSLVGIELKLLKNIIN